MRDDLKTAFTLAIVGYCVAVTYLIGFLMSLYTRITIFDGISTLTWIVVGIAFFIGSLVCGSIALSMVKKITNIKRSERVFYILTRVFSLVTIISSAIILGILVIVFLIYSGMH